MAKTLAFLNFKGGVSKTTTTVNLGAALALAGKRVLLVDCDPQSHLAAHLGVDQDSIEGGEAVEDVLRKKNGSIADIALTTNTENLFLAPSTNALANARSELASRPMREGLLKRALKSMQREVDFILVDSPPDEGLLSVNALYACDGLIIPTTLDQFAVSGVPKVLAVRESLSEAFDREWPLLGSVICRHDSRTTKMNKMTREMLESIVGEEMVFASRIRTDESVKKAQNLGKTLFEYEAQLGRSTNAAADYRCFAEELLERLTLSRAA